MVIDDMLRELVVQFPMVTGFVVAFGVLWQWLTDVQNQVDDNQQRLDTYHEKLENCLSDKSKGER